VVLLHLDRPLVDVEPMKFVARIGPTHASEATYPIDPSTWPGAVIATVVGVGSSNPMPPPSPLILGPRMYGPTAVTALGWKAEDVLQPDQCDFQTGSFSCDRCMIDISPSPSAQLPQGGAARQGGDSGAPLIVNATALGATPIAGLPEGEPFVVGFGSNGWPDEQRIHDLSAASWDATASPDGPTEMGTLLLRHLRDWDQDGVLDAYDNCVLAPNAGQENCNEDAEDKWGFPHAGDACDPVPCADAPFREPVNDVETTVQSKFFSSQFGRRIQDRFDMAPRGSHYTASGVQNHVALPEVGVGTVQTHYRFCQRNLAANVLCDHTAINNIFLH
jgi:hypothetical protein